MAALVCPFFPHADAQLGYPSCPATKPKRAVVHEVSDDIVTFTTPKARVRSGTRANEPDSTKGLVYYVRHQLSQGAYDDAAEITCRLQASRQQLCGAIIQNYIRPLERADARYLTAIRHRQASTSTPQPPTPPGSTQPGFLAYASNGALFIQWTRTGGRVSGTYSQSFTPQGDPSHVTHESDSFTGSVSGSSVTLTLDNGTNLNGTLSGDTITLTQTNSNGTLATFTFHNSTVAAYNAAVSQLAAQAKTSANVQQWAQQQQQEQADLDQGATTVASDVSAVGTAAAQLKSDLGQVPSDLGQMRSDLASEKSDLQQLLSDRSSNCQGDGAYQVTGTDTYQVTGTDAYQVTGTDGYTIKSDQQALKQAVAALVSDAKNESDAEAQLLGFTPAGLPSPTAIERSVSSASAAATSARQTWSGYLQTVKQLDAQANAYAAQAKSACAT